MVLQKHKKQNIYLKQDFFSIHSFLLKVSLYLPLLVIHRSSDTTAFQQGGVLINKEIRETALYPGFILWAEPGHNRSYSMMNLLQIWDTAGKD